MTTIDLNRLWGFHLVASCGGYAKAARAADYPITQPALHQQVRKLEQQVGVPLLERVGKDTMQPTPAGDQLLRFVSPFLRDLPRIVARARSGDYAGSLSIHAESLLIRKLLPQWLLTLQRRRPGAELRLHELRHVDLELLRSGRADVLVGHLPEIPDDIAAQPVATVYACLLVPRANAPTRGRPKPAQLDALPFLSYPPDTRHHALQLEALARDGITPASTLALDTADTIQGYVEAGLGWSLVPSLEPEGPRNRRLRSYPWGRPRTSFSIQMMWRRDAPEHPLLDEMIATAPSPR